MVKLDSLLEQIETTAVNMEFLRKRLPSDVLVTAYAKLKGKHRSDLFRGKRAVVVLIPKKNTKQGHFVVLLPRKHHIEYFSSLGGSPESELAALNEPLTIFRNLLGKDFIYNRLKLQQGKYSIKSCAAWVLARVYLSHLKLREFQEVFRRPITLSDPDLIVSTMVLLHFVNKSE